MSDSIAALEAWIHQALPAEYSRLLIDQGGKFLGPSVRLYAADEVIERNQTYESQLYCPGFIAIGDDSGGRAIVIGTGDTSGPVFIVDQGAMSPDDFVQLAKSLEQWAEQSYPVN
jgi:hypothetical protein